jgi:hypothetical protein
MSKIFHLAIPAGDLHNAIYFYCNILGCTKGNSEIKPLDAWCDINFWGNELTLHDSSRVLKSEQHNVGMGKVLVPHFGAHLEANEFKDLKERLEHHDVKFVEKPYVRFQGELLEQETMFIEDPNGNILEMKTMVNPDELFNQ